MTLLRITITLCICLKIVLLLQHLSLLQVHITIIPGLISLPFNLHIKLKTKKLQLMHFWVRKMLDKIRSNVVS